LFFAASPTQDDVLANIPLTRKHIRTLHTIHCLSGNNTEFIDEFEFLLKSLLVNAPLDSHLHIHILADKDAAIQVNSRIRGHRLVGSLWRNQVTIVLHEIEAMIPAWKDFLSDALTTEHNRWMDEKVGIGGYLRLLAHRIIVPFECPQNSCTDFSKRDLREAVYMDTDVIIIANLNHLMHTTSIVLNNEASKGNPRPVFIWNDNSGFIVVDLLQFESMWGLAASIPDKIKNSPDEKKGDQWLLVKLCASFPDRHLAALMPKQWSTHTGHDGFRKHPQNLYSERQNGTGMLHFTAPDHFGGNIMIFGGVHKWCKFSPECNHTDESPGGDLEKVKSSWGLAEYYARLSWDWALYQGGLSRLQDNRGHALKLIQRAVYPDLVVDLPNR
jgi:hypothetical protein